MYEQQHRQSKLYVHRAELEAKCLRELRTLQDVEMVQRGVVGQWMDYAKETAQSLASTEQLETGGQTVEGQAPEDEWNCHHAARVLEVEHVRAGHSWRRGGGRPRAYGAGCGKHRAGSESKSCELHDGTA